MDETATRNFTATYLAKRCKCFADAYALNRKKSSRLPGLFVWPLLGLVLFADSANLNAQSKLNGLSEIGWQPQHYSGRTIRSQSTLDTVGRTAPYKNSISEGSSFNLPRNRQTKTTSTSLIPREALKRRYEKSLSSIETPKETRTRQPSSQIVPINRPISNKTSLAKTQIEHLPDPPRTTYRLPKTDTVQTLPPIKLDSERKTTETHEAESYGEEILPPVVAVEENTPEMKIPTPWWALPIQGPLLDSQNQHRQLGLMECVHLALQNAPQIEVIRAEVGIRRQEIVRQSAVFDWTSFLESQWQDISEPVGDQLQGVQSRFRDNNWTARGGVRRRNRIGGQVEVGQELGHRNTNSRFFSPLNQGSSRVVFEYTQPLLRGGGHAVNHSIVELAIADSVAADNAFVAQLQDYILDVIRAYWNLVQLRGELVILRQSVERATGVVTKIEGRQAVDVNPLQMVRAEATEAARRGQIIQAVNAVRQAQDGLLQLVYGANFRDHAESEIIPTEFLSCPIAPLPMHATVEKGLQNRPELRETVQLIKRASLEKGIAKNDLLPILDLTLSVSNSALQGNSDVHRAWLEQFELEEPSYVVGFSFEYPIGNRAARARHEQTLIALRRFQKQFETVIADVTLEVRNAFRDVVAARDEYQAKVNALTLAQQETFLIQKRYELLLDGNDVGRLYLGDLLQTQERLAQAELEALAAQAKCAASIFELERTTGTLLRLNAATHSR